MEMIPSEKMSIFSLYTTIGDDAPGFGCVSGAAYSGVPGTGEADIPDLVYCG